MGRILAVDDDVLSRAILVDALRSLGHEVGTAPGGVEALERLLQEPYDVVVTQVALRGMDGLELARRVASRATPIPLVLVGASSPTDLLAVPHIGLVPRPIDVDRLGRILDTVFAPARIPAPAPGRSSPSGGGSGVESLAAIAGPLDRFPPIRVLFLAHRLGATGAMRVEREGKVTVVGVRSGNVVHLSGVPGLFAGLVLPVTQEDLAAGLGVAVAAGHAPSDALAAAAEGLGVWLATLVDARGGGVTFDQSWSPPAGSFALPDAIPRMLARGLALGRSDASIARTWRALDVAGLSPRLPRDSAESRWGIDSTSMRVLRLAKPSRTVEVLLREAAGTDAARRTEVLRALDTLTVLGLLVVDGGGIQRAERVTAKGPPVEPTQEDTRAQRLAEAAAAMERGHPIEILQLTGRSSLSEEDVANAYREISRQFHPDTYFNAPPAVRVLAEVCFGRVNAAYDALRAPEGLAEARRHLRAIATGAPYVSMKDRLAARLAFRRGEVAWRARDWAGADPLFQEAARLDPQAWPHALHAAYCGYLARRASAIETLVALTAVEGAFAQEPIRAAEVLVYAGKLLKQEGREAEALARYRAAVQKDPNNRDALREVRLFEVRNPAPSRPGPAGAGGVFGGMFGPKKD
ncbi:MAG: response regulator [Pseudomonadota bacterium]|nr:response regulator [Pseudomonadota bacterium]